MVYQTDDGRYWRPEAKQGRDHVRATDVELRYLPETGVLRLRFADPAAADGRGECHEVQVPVTASAKWNEFVEGLPQWDLPPAVRAAAADPGETTAKPAARDEAVDAVTSAADLGERGAEQVLDALAELGAVSIDE